MQAPTLPSAITSPYLRPTKLVRVFLALSVTVLCTNLAKSAHAAVKVNPPAAKTDIGAIANQELDSAVEVEATVKSISKPGEGSKAPVKISIADNTGEITLIIWQDVFKTVQTQYDLSPGDTIRVRARVTEFRGERQLTLRNVEDLSVLSKGEAAKGSSPGEPSTPTLKTTTPLANINNSLMGKEVLVQGSITDIREPQSEKAPFIVTLSEGEAKVPLVFWSDLQTQIAQYLKVGNVVRVKAIVNEYRGTLQLRLRDAKDLEVVAPKGSDHSDTGQTEKSVSAQPAGGKAEIGKITEEWADRTVTVAGEITASESLGKGQRLRLRDQTGEIQVILWDNVLSRLRAEELQKGRQLSVTGRAKLYRGHVEVVPGSADAVISQVN